MKKSTEQILNELFVRYPALKPIRESLFKATKILIYSYQNDGKLLVCGNGGSAADSQHIVGELMKGFCLSRQLSAPIEKKLRSSSPDADLLVSNLQMTLPAISLVNETGLLTAFANDKVPELCFAQAVLGYGKTGDVFLGISTSGNSKNVVYASEVAKALGLKTIALTGEKQSKLSDVCDIAIRATASETYKIQELHLPIYHAICLALENEFFGEEK